jgi:hypothetical protein
MAATRAVVGSVAACALLLALLALASYSSLAPRAEPAAGAAGAGGAAAQEQQGLARRLLQKGPLFKTDLVYRRFRFFNSFARSVRAQRRRRPN